MLLSPTLIQVKSTIYINIIFFKGFTPLSLPLIKTNKLRNIFFYHLCITFNIFCSVNPNNRTLYALYTSISHIHRSGSNKTKKILFLFIHIPTYKNTTTKFVNTSFLYTIKPYFKWYLDIYNAIITFISSPKSQFTSENRLFMLFNICNKSNLISSLVQGFAYGIANFFKL